MGVLFPKNCRTGGLLRDDECLRRRMASEKCSILDGDGVINIMGDNPLTLRGRIRPGNSIGITTFNGNVVFDTITCATQIEFASTNSFDQVVVNGAATINGAIVELTTINGGVLNYGDQIPFLTASGGVTGMYAAAAVPEGYRVNVLRSTNTVTLVMAPQSYTQVATTPNQQQVAGALDNFITGTITNVADDCLPPLRGVGYTIVMDGGDRGDVSLALDQLTAAQYAAAFEQMMPSIYTTLPALAFNQANALNMNMFQRMWTQRMGGAGFSTQGLDPAPISDGKQFVPADGKSVLPPDGKSSVSPATEAPVALWETAGTQWGLFVDGNGIFSTMDNIGSLGNYNSQGGGVNVGLSYRWNENLTTGVYVGYQGLQAEYDNGSRLIDNAVRFGLFGSWGKEWGPGEVYVNAIVGGAYHGYDIDRKIQFGTIDRTARGTPGAWELDAALATGYNFEAGGFVFGPVTSLQYTYLAVEGFTETGAGSLNLDVDPYHSSSLLYSLGGQVAYPIQATRNLTLTPMLFASWQHEFLQNAYKINSAFVGGGDPAPFSYETNDPLRDFLYAGVGIGWAWGDRWEGYVSYSASAGNPQLISHNIFLGVGVKF
jgi:fibronectin-binding autotransporter adhesin